MIRRHGTSLRNLLMVTDAVVAVGVVLFVYSLRFLSPTPPPPDGTSIDSAWTATLLYALAWVGLLYLVGEYKLRARWTMRSEIVGIARATVWLALLGMSVLFLTNMDHISRLFLLMLFPIQGLVTIATRAILRWSFMFVRARGRNNRFILILGTGSNAFAFAQQVEEHTAFGVRVVGLIGEPPASTDPRWPYLGPLSSILRIFHEQIVDEVAICLPQTEWNKVEELIAVCQEEGKIVRVPLEAPQVGAGLRFVEDLDGTAVLSLVPGPDQRPSLAIKRAIDILVASAALVVFAPLLLGVALYIRWRNGSPILFRQTRIGMHGRTFTILKFRTMVDDAEARYAEVAAHSTTRGAAFKMLSDPRVTESGRWLRRTSLDELPQLWNVLKGDMSLVGPRPAPPREVDRYDPWHRRRLSMKPGMTGLWQISSRLDADFDHRAKLDLDYIDRWSIWLDLRIVARTVPAVLHLGGH